MVKICDVVNGCEDCPKYGDDCDGDKMTEHTELISRADAIEALSRSSVYAWSTEQDLVAHSWAIRIVQSLPSADEQVTGKLKNPCDSLLTEDSEKHKEQESKLGLIRREDAIAAIDDAIDADFPQWAILRTKIGFLPSVGAVQGEWKQEYRKTANGVDFCVIACSECDYYDAQMHYYAYCPSCGSYMRKKGGAE